MGFAGVINYKMWSECDKGYVKLNTGNDML